MSVEFISGKPGDGKSLRAMMIIEEELRLTKRNIITNLAIKVPQLAEELNQRYGDSFDINLRLRILTPEELLNFWLYPAPGVDLDPRTRVKWEAANGRKMDVPDLSGIETAAPEGALVVVDEAHIPFGARSWQANGTDGFYFLSQHRKFKFDVLLVTQHVENVDKQFRSVASGFVYMKNRTNRNLPVLGGLIRQASGFTQMKFSEPYRMGLHSEETRYFRAADKLWLANCYDTTAGVGVSSRNGPEVRRKRGLPIWTVVVPIVFFFVVLNYGTDALFKSVSGVKQSAVVTAVPAPAAVPVPLRPQPVGDPLYVKSETNTNRLTGIAKLGSEYVFYFENGRTFSSNDPEYLAVLRDGIGRMIGVVKRTGERHLLQ